MPAHAAWGVEVQASRMFVHTVEGIRRRRTIPLRTPLNVSDDPHPQGRTDAVDRHKAELIARAVELARARPDLRIVGLVAEADAPEAPALRATLPAEKRDPRSSVAVVVTRESAKDLLGTATPGLLDWLDDDERDGSRRRLPIVHAALRGMRTTAIEYEMPD